MVGKTPEQRLPQLDPPQLRPDRQQRTPWWPQDLLKNPLGIVVILAAGAGLVFWLAAVGNATEYSQELDRRAEPSAACNDLY